MKDDNETVLIPLTDRHSTLAKTLREPLKDWLLHEYSKHQWRCGCWGLFNAALTLLGLFAFAWNPLMMLLFLATSLVVDTVFQLVSAWRNRSQKQALFAHPNHALSFAFAFASGHIMKTPEGAPALPSSSMPMEGIAIEAEINDVSMNPGSQWLALTIGVVFLLPSLLALYRQFDPAQWSNLWLVVASIIMQSLFASRTTHLAEVQKPWRWNHPMGLSAFGLAMLGMISLAFSLPMLDSARSPDQLNHTLQDIKVFVAFLAVLRALWAFNQLFAARHSRRLTGQLDALKNLP